MTFCVTKLQSTHIDRISESMHIVLCRVDNHPMTTCTTWPYVPQFCTGKLSVTDVSLLHSGYACIRYVGSGCYTRCNSPSFHPMKALTRRFISCRQITHFRIFDEHSSQQATWPHGMIIIFDSLSMQILHVSRCFNSKYFSLNTLNSVNKTSIHMYTATRGKVKTVSEYINSALATIFGSQMTINIKSNFLRQPPSLRGHFWWLSWLSVLTQVRQTFRATYGFASV